MYKLIYLDADDTLFDYIAAEKMALENTFNKYGIIVNKDFLAKYAVINKKLWIDYENSKITQEQLRIERFRLLLQEEKLTLNTNLIAEEYINWLSESGVLFENTEQVCKYLHDKYTLAIITNGIGFVQRNRLNKSSINKYITQIVISEEAGFNKPNIGIFLYAENILKINKKEEILIVGDSLTSDIQGGINYGIDACWFNPKKVVNNSSIKPKYEISDIVELMDFL